MKWPLKRKPIPKSETPFFNHLYLNARGRGGPDSTIVWTSEIPWQPLKRFIDGYNQNNDCMISSSALLVQAVGQALAQHPELNRRVVGRRVFEFANCHVCLATRVPRANEVNVIAVEHVQTKSVGQIAAFLWKKQLTFHRNDSPYLRDRERLKKLPGWIFRTMTKLNQFVETIVRLPSLGRIDRLKESAVLVNDFSHPRFPVMRGYKPSRQPDESKPLNVTLGRPEERLVLDAGVPQPQPFAPICIRADHRICDSFQLSQFVSTLVKLLSAPVVMQETAFANSQHAQSHPTNSPPATNTKAAA